MLDPIDYKEPACALCEGKDFYYPDKDAPKGTIPVRSVLEKIDKAEWKNDMAEAGRLLEYWVNEGVQLGDKRGLLTLYSEQMGYYRKIRDEEKGLRSVENGLALLQELDLSDSISGATIMLNAATTMKAFGKASSAAPLYDEVEKIYTKYLNKKDDRWAGLYNNSALSFADLCEYDRAKESYFKALDVLKENENTENEVAITYVNLAHLFETIDQEEKSYEYMEKALEVLNSDTVTRDGKYANTCDKCAGSFGYFGYFLAEEELRKRAKEIYERA